jgi:hypothetical protein
MSMSAALYQILFQNDTLFRLGDPPLNDTETLQINKPEPVSPKLVTTLPPKMEPIIDIPVAAVASPNVPVSRSTENFPALSHKVLILLDEPKQREMIVSESLFLDNILKAVGHSVEKADILNFSFLPGQDARSVLSEKKTNFFITFGVPLIKLNLDLLLAPYTPKFIDGIWFLLAEPLTMIEADRNLKKKLWQALQKMFEMS